MFQNTCVNKSTNISNFYYHQLNSYYMLGLVLVKSSHNWEREVSLAPFYR